ncbi:hypothetical protein KY334_03020 [Candidatus Woesearchaeota archaeon]|nr:hypothetical protein [Candidatus Woesearchaeota archaeon]
MKYWFRKRRGLFSRDLGWGWIPISIEGWICTFVLLILIILSAYDSKLYDESKINVIRFLISLIILLVLFTALAVQKTRPEKKER